MSQQPQADHHADAHTSHDEGHDNSGYHATVKGYVQGFLLSVILTAIPFWLVMAKALPTPGITAAVILLLAAVQIVVHMVYFLHMGPKVEGGWSLLALIFTGAVLAIMLSGSIWVMYHLNTNMMPVGAAAHRTQEMP